MSDKEQLDYEVYIARYHGVKYVGSGMKGRHRHLLSGKSHVLQANKFFFEKGKKLKIEVIPFSSKEDALIEERRLIRELSPLWNTTHNTRYPKGMSYRKSNKIKLLVEQGRLSSEEGDLLLSISKYIARCGTGVVTLRQIQQDITRDDLSTFMDQLCDRENGLYEELKKNITVDKIDFDSYKVDLTPEEPKRNPKKKEPRPKEDLKKQWRAHRDMLKWIYRHHLDENQQVVVNEREARDAIKRFSSLARASGYLKRTGLFDVEGMIEVYKLEEDKYIIRILEDKNDNQSD